MRREIRRTDAVVFEDCPGDVCEDGRRCAVDLHRAVRTPAQPERGFPIGKKFHRDDCRRSPFDQLAEIIERLLPLQQYLDVPGGKEVPRALGEGFGVQRGPPFHRPVGVPVAAEEVLAETSQIHRISPDLGLENIQVASVVQCLPGQ